MSTPNQVKIEPITKTKVPPMPLIEEICFSVSVTLPFNLTKCLLLSLTLSLMCSISPLILVICIVKLFNISLVVSILLIP